jgi:hypothetical protein
MTYHALVAKNEWVMARPATSIRIKVEGNNLWFIVPRTGQPGETRTKLMRVE